MRALDVNHKSERVARFHRNTMEALGEMTGAAGLHHPGEFLPYHMMLRGGDRSMVEASDVYAYQPDGYLLDNDADDYMGNKSRWARARAESFARVE